MNEHHPDEDELIALALGEAGGEDWPARHAASCPACGESVAAYAELIRAAREADRPLPPPEILAALLKAQAQVTSPRRTGRGFALRFVAAAAIAGLLFLSGFWTGRATSKEAAAPTPGSSYRAGRLPQPPDLPFQTAYGLDVGTADTIAFRDRSRSWQSGPGDSL